MGAKAKVERSIRKESWVRDGDSLEYSFRK